MSEGKGYVKKYNLESKEKQEYFLFRHQKAAFFFSVSESNL